MDNLHHVHTVPVALMVRYSALKNLVVSVYIVVFIALNMYVSTPNLCKEAILFIDFVLA